MMKKDLLLRTQGADVVEGGVRFRTWAPGKKKVEAVICETEGVVSRSLELMAEDGGYFSALDERGSAGEFYKYRLEGEEWPDPASRFNPTGVHGFSEVVDPSSFAWRDEEWRCPPLSEIIIYELHIGTFTDAGTFRAAQAKLDHLVRLGVTAIEIMPVADFPGERSWGYDGVLLYAPARVYGQPNELRALVAAAHERRLAVILDVVYNHLGPDGNYLGCYSRDYFNPAHKTPWGDALNFELRPVRELFAENAEYWRREFHIDGFRLDATHAIVDRSEKHILQEITERIHSLGGFVTIEDERNDVRLLEQADRGGFGVDGRWADDFHHVIRVMLTGAREGYYRSYEGGTNELTETLRDGWLLNRERQPKSAAEAVGVGELKPEKLIFCISNHDQIGNQAFGQRLSELTSPAAYRAASALLCLAPYTPLLFMGQEWAASSPFQFFTDHEPDLGRRVTEGRREEFKGFAAFHDPKTREKIPDPQAVETFLRSKLRWEEIDKDEQHAAVLRLYVELLRMRHTLPALRNRARHLWQVTLIVPGILSLTYGDVDVDQVKVIVSLTSKGLETIPEDKEWECLLSTNEKRFGGEEEPSFSQPELRVSRRRRRD
jgi:maltooligosyltrehalose trehalohydrolase